MQMRKYEGQVLKKHKLILILVIILLYNGSSSFISSMDATGLEGQQLGAITNKIIKNPSKSVNYAIHTPIHIMSDEELAEVAIKGTGTAVDPYILENWLITPEFDPGIAITNTTKHFIIRNCWIEPKLATNTAAIDIHDTAAGTVSIINNTCLNYGGGVSIRNSYNVTICNNSCLDNMVGITLYKSHFSILDQNTVRNWGMVLDYSYLLQVTNNTCINGSIWLRNSPSSILRNNSCTGSAQMDGSIQVDKSDNSKITYNHCKKGNILLEDLNSVLVDHNIVQEHSFAGIRLVNAKNCTLTWNALIANQYGGIELNGDTNNLLIHHNAVAMTGNTNNSQAIDNGFNNSWYDSTTQKGNYWRDYSGNGTYFIDGDAKTNDSYPLLDSPLNICPSITYAPENVTIEGGTTNHIYWVVIDENPANYSFYEDNKLINEGNWTRRVISGSFLNEMSNGTHVIVLRVIDASGNSITDSISITIIATEKTEDEIRLIYGFEIVLVVFSLILRRKLRKRRKES